jgi:hypothetical protein
LGAKDFKRDYAKEQLRENMGQSKSKERGFKQGFKEDFRSKVLKTCKGVRPQRIKIEKRSSEGWASPPECPTYLTPLSFCLSCVFSESPVAPS